MAKQKYYVVWEGREPGIYSNWEECKKQVDGFVGARYKSFQTAQLAEKAFDGNSNEFIGHDFIESTLSEEELLLIGNPIEESIVVDGAWNTNSGAAEYRGIDFKTKKELFHQGPFADGTNNIVEFLAIVHALAYCKNKALATPIYSDSKTAISWAKRKTARTKHDESEANKKLFELIERGEKWLKENSYPNKILKWESRAWGENPADFGRK
ncbi:MAG: ribonuclease H family protein [Bacteroidetes bacterium]|nr:ribonuclease H family protein [Bacteroidota bacterium]